MGFQIVRAVPPAEGPVTQGKKMCRSATSTAAQVVHIVPLEIKTLVHSPVCAMSFRYVTFFFTFDRLNPTF